MKYEIVHHYCISNYSEQNTTWLCDRFQCQNPLRNLVSVGYFYLYRCSVVDMWQLNGIKVPVFFKKNVEKKPLCCHVNNTYYFCKSNIPVINLIASSRNMIKVSKNMSFEKIKLTTRVVFTKY